MDRQRLVSAIRMDGSAKRRTGPAPQSVICKGQGRLTRGEIKFIQNTGVIRFDAITSRSLTLLIVKNKKVKSKQQFARCDNCVLYKSARAQRTKSTTAI